MDPMGLGKFQLSEFFDEGFLPASLKSRNLKALLIRQDAAKEKPSSKVEVGEFLVVFLEGCRP